MRICLLSILASCALLAACAPDFSDYNQVDKLRVLALRASPPDLHFEDETTLDVLLVGSVDRYEWSWCPFSFVDAAEGECGVPEEDFRMLLDEVGGTAPPFDLGNDPTVAFQHTIPPGLLDALCTQLGDIELPPGFEVPDCDGRFDISIRLLVSGDDGELVTTRRLSLIYQSNLVPNQNPQIIGGEMSVRGAPPFPFLEDTPTVVARDVEYLVDLEIAEDAIETYDDSVDGTGETVERLSISWFYEGGGMDKSRSSFIDGIISQENLETNTYRTPTEEEFPDGVGRLFFVIRDERGGLSWFTSTLEFSL